MRKRFTKKQSFLVDRGKTTKKIFLSVCSGICLVLSFPRFNINIAAWFGLVPLLIALDEENLLHSFWSGFLTGVVFFLGSLYWIVNTMVDYGHLPLPLSYLILILLVCYLSLYFGLFCYFLVIISRHKPIYKWLSAPFLWVSLEFIRCRFLSGFPWASLGYSQFDSLTIIQISDITGIYGVSFLIVMVNTTTGYLIENFLREKKGLLMSQRHSRFSTRPVIIAVMIFCLCYVYGLLRIDENKSSESGARSVRVKVIQGNIDQDKKWDKTYQAEVFDTYKALTLQDTMDETPELIVWPETATPFYFDSNKEYRNRMFDLAEEADTHLFFGSPRYTIDNETVSMFNSAYLISPESETKGSYDKMHLVPFGEYVPFRRLLWFVEKMADGIGDFVSGKEFKVFSIPEAGFSSLICFEIIFPNQVRKFVKNGAQFLVNLTNDAWFGRSAASYQHIAMVAFRAVENRVPVVRAANTGISAIITPYGEIKEPTDIFVSSTINGNIVPKVRENTFYTTYGDVFVYMGMIFLAALGMLSIVSGY